MKATWMGMMILMAATRSYGEQDILPRPPKPGRAANALASLLADTRVGEPQHNRSLTVFPLFTGNRAQSGYWTLDQALAKGVMRISERGHGSVPALLVENQTDEPIFLMAGEIVTGGKQNRAISQDILLAPRSGSISLGVFCVEQGRWTSQRSYFSAEKDCANNALRQRIGAGMYSQSEVWRDVAAKSAAVAPGVANETHYLGKIYEADGVKRDLDDYTKAIVWTEDANGMAVMIGGRVVGVEIFGDSETFTKLRDKLLRSYAVDAIEFSAVEKPSAGREVVERFLQNARAAQLTPKTTIGIGRLFGVEGRSVYGSMLVWPEQRGAHGVVHASLFEDSRGDSRPPVVPMPRPLPRYQD